MKISVSFSLCFYLLALVIAKQTVLELEPEEIEGFVKKHNITMIKIYRNYCTYCKWLGPQYIRAARTAALQNKPYIFAKINVQENENIDSFVEVKENPALKLFINGVAIDCEWNITAEDILAFIESKVADPSHELESEAEISELSEKGGNRVILCSTNPDLVQKYMNMIRDENKFEFYHTAFDKAKKILEAPSENTVVLFEADGTKQVFDKYGLPMDQFKKFLRTNEFPITIDCSNEILETIEDKKRTGFFLFREDNDPNFGDIEKSFQEFAKKYRSSERLFVISNFTDEACKTIGETYGITKSKMPTLQVLRKENELKRYELGGELSLKTLEKFMKDFEAGKVDRAYKSEDIPEYNPGPVFTVVRKNFWELVLYETKDVLVKFYAPWCRYCNLLAPIYKEAAEKLLSVPTVRLVEIDSTKNDIPVLQIQGFPTLILFKAKDKTNLIYFDREQTVDGIINFVKEHSSFSETKIDL